MYSCDLKSYHRIDEINIYIYYVPIAAIVVGFVSNGLLDLSLHGSNSMLNNNMKIKMRRFIFNQSNTPFCK